MFGKIANSLPLLKDDKGKNINKFTAWWDDGNINIYYLIYIFLKVKKHKKSFTYLACLTNGKIIFCSQDGTIKLIEEKYLNILIYMKYFKK